jgi:hypothetical protein
VSTRALRIHGVAAGLGVLFVELWPVLLIWRAGASGSVGDLSEVRFLWVGVVYALALAVWVARLMERVLLRATEMPSLGRYDPWGAYALGLGVYNLALTAIPGLLWALLLTDENQSLRSREWLLWVIWIGGKLVAAMLALAAGRALLRWRSTTPAAPRAP